jgi:hypothetical protein
MAVRLVLINSDGLPVSAAVLIVTMWRLNEREFNFL